MEMEIHSAANVNNTASQQSTCQDASQYNAWPLRLGALLHNSLASV